MHTLGDDNGMKPLTILLFSLLIAGCAGMNYVLDNYSGVSPVEHVMVEDTYRIFDKPSQNRLMITPSLGSSVASGAAIGLFGASETVGPKPVFSKAVLSYLKSTGRECKIIDGYVVLSPQWEFKYQC